MQITVPAKYVIEACDARRDEIKRNAREMRDRRIKARTKPRKKLFGLLGEYTPTYEEAEAEVTSGFSDDLDVRFAKILEGEITHIQRAADKAREYGGPDAVMQLGPDELAKIGSHLPRPR